MLFKNKSIADVLDMTVEEALDFFKAVPRVRDILTLLRRVGLDYIHVGQQATTLSGGEAQRVKLAKELSKRATGRTLYILDEPTTGLHFHDVAKLLEVLHELVESGNTVVVIEHNLEVLKTADWIIDLGPEGGDGGGEIVATGTPEDETSPPSSAAIPGSSSSRCWRAATPAASASGASRRRSKCPGLLYYYEIRRINAGRAMPLLAFWESNPEEVGKSSIEQIVAMAGDGNLKDGSSCSDELRKYLAEAEFCETRNVH